MAGVIAFCVPVAAAVTTLAGAELDIRHIDGCTTCHECASEFPADTLFIPCPRDSRRTTRIRGDEPNVKQMELEEID